MLIEDIESRFKEVTGLTSIDLSLPSIPRNLDSQQKTTKSEFKDFGFVCSPLWLVDQMLEPEMGKLTLESKTCDACSGCGQFTIRMMRKFKTRFPDMDESKWLRESHCFTEFQSTNVAKLVYIFGPDINVYVGDSRNMKLAKEGEKGIMFFNPKEGRWFNIPGLRNMVEPMKDDLNALMLVFSALGKRLSIA